MGKVSNKLFENKEQIIELINQKKTYKEIAQLFGCSDTSIRMFCINNNIVTARKNNKYEIIGQSFETSKLKVLDIDLNPPYKSHETGYKCECLLCGDVRTYRKSNVINGPGCHDCSGTDAGRGYRKWQIGDTFGYVTIIGENESKRDGYAMGRCKCGTVREFYVSDLRLKKIMSCGCLNKSRGECLIEDILIANDIEFKSQYCIPEFSKYALFDFALYKQGKLIGLLEYDGEQHFRPVEHFGGEEKFQIQQERDARKTKWCMENNIRLVRIPYTEFRNITLGYLLSFFPELKDNEGEAA